MSKTIKWEEYSNYNCHCGKPAGKSHKRKDGTSAPKIGKNTQVPVCHVHYREENYSHVQGGVSQYDKTRRNKNKRKNWNILCMLYYGRFVPFKRRTCLFSGELIYKKKIKGKDFCNLSEIHHLHVQNAASTYKREKQPSSMLELARLSSADITELLGTMVINNQYHKYIHSHDANLDYRILSKEQLPFVLKSEENFEKICKEYSLVIHYQGFMESLQNNKMPKRLIHEDWI